MFVAGAGQAEGWEYDRWWRQNCLRPQITTIQDSRGVHTNENLIFDLYHRLVRVTRTTRNGVGWTPYNLQMKTPRKGIFSVVACAADPLAPCHHTTGGSYLILGQPHRTLYWIGCV